MIYQWTFSPEPVSAHPRKFHSGHSTHNAPTLSCVTQPDEGEIWPSLRGQWRVGKSMGVLQPIHTHTQDIPLTCCRDCSIPRCTFVHLAYLTSSYYEMQLSAHTRSPCTYVGCVIWSAEGDSQLCYMGSRSEAYLWSVPCHTHQQTNPLLDSTGEHWTAIPEPQLLLARYLTG